MNKRMKRFLETTLPIVILYGLVLVAVTHYVGKEMGIIGVITFAIVDLVFVGITIPEDVNEGENYP